MSKKRTATIQEEIDYIEMTWPEIKHYESHIYNVAMRTDFESGSLDSQIQAMCCQMLISLLRVRENEMDVL